MIKIVDRLVEQERRVALLERKSGQNSGESGYLSLTLNIFSDELNVVY